MTNKVMLIDDNETNLRVMKVILEKAGFKTDTIVKPKFAFDIIKESQPCVILLDINMPEINGFQLCKLLKKDNQTAHIPIIFVSAFSDVKYIAGGLMIGGADYITKPISPRTLEDIIRKYLPKSLIETVEPSQESSGTNTPSDSNDELPQIEGIDMATCMEYCGTKEILTDMLLRFYKTIQPASDELEALLAKEDLENYRIKVHALKSSAKLVGAMELSAKAAELEHDSEEHNLEIVNEKTPALLDLYRSYLEKLSNFVNNIKISNSEKTPISPEEFSQKLNSLAKIVDDFDSIQMDEWLKEMSKFEIPDESSDLFEKIKTSIENIDFDNLKILLME